MTRGWLLPLAAFGRLQRAAATWLNSDRAKSSKCRRRFAQNEDFLLAIHLFFKDLPRCKHSPPDKYGKHKNPVDSGDVVAMDLGHWQFDSLPIDLPFVVITADHVTRLQASAHLSVPSAVVFQALLTHVRPSLKESVWRLLSLNLFFCSLLNIF